MYVRKAAAVLSLIGCLAFIGSPARAADLTFDFKNIFTQSAAPTGAGPWLRAEFTNFDPSSVDLTLTALFQANSNEFIGRGGVHFNFDPTKSLPTIFTHIGGQAFDAIVTGVDSQSAASGGDFDMVFRYKNGGAGRFTDGETTTYRISNAQAADFLFLSEPGSNGSFYAATHIQGTGADTQGSAWVTPQAVPEPAFYQMGTLLALGGIAFARQRGKKK